MVEKKKKNRESTERLLHINPKQMIVLKKGKILVIFQSPNFTCDDFDLNENGEPTN